jgi:hypothetical protein
MFLSCGVFHPDDGDYAFSRNYGSITTRTTPCHTIRPQSITRRTTPCHRVRPQSITRRTTPCHRIRPQSITRRTTPCHSIRPQSITRRTTPCHRVRPHFRFEHLVQEFEWVKAVHALDRVATVSGPRTVSGMHSLQERAAIFPSL